ncbi:hypothetical protein RJT34_32127 [Clitoria ternatea]|uniref:Uncharacterized protein n=1 Tax=Clitoria ternatea TaxID=43366 RepID=A0AAN9I200_CLITE
MTSVSECALDGGQFSYDYGIRGLCDLIIDSSWMLFGGWGLQGELNFLLGDAEVSGKGVRRGVNVLERSSRKGNLQLPFTLSSVDRSKIPINKAPNKDPTLAFTLFSPNDYSPLSLSSSLSLPPLGSPVSSQRL